MVVATTHDWLAPIALAAVESGKHVLVEKPAARSAAELEPVIAAARRAWETALTMMNDPDYAMVILDELNVVLRYGYLPLPEVLDGLKARPKGQHVVVTGRNAAAELIDAADLVTEMTLVKHPFRDGVKAQAGVEF